MATKSWATETTANWATGARWTPANTPGASDDVYITVGGGTAYTISVAANLVGGGVNSLTIGSADATLRLSNGTTGRPMTIANATSITAGTLLIDQSASRLTTGSLAIGGSAGSLIETSGTLAVGSGGITIDNGGALSISAGTFTDSGGLTVNGTGTFTGFGTVSGAVAGTGTITASGGTLNLAGGASGVALQVANASTAKLQLGAATSSDITFLGSSGALEFGTAGALSGYTGTIHGMTLGGSASSVSGTNFINFQGTVTNVTVGAGGTNLFDGSTTVITLYNGATVLGTLTLASPPPAGAFIDWGSDSSVNGGVLGGTDLFLSTVVCFAAGTRILTPSGERVVEDLAPGDLIMAGTGVAQASEPVKWVGYRRIDLRTHPNARAVAPVRIRRGAFGENLPHRDLVVSPDHCLFIDGKLFPAKLLINGMTIVQELDTPTVTYYHVELERHSILLAEGLPAETYLDTGNRAFFSNAGLALMLHPEFTVNANLRCWETDACAPLTISADLVQPVWRILADRAEALGYAPPVHETTQDADLHLSVDGRRIAPIAIEGRRHVFMLPAGATDVRLVSRATVPADLRPWLDDPRPLGVAVRRIVVRSGADYVDFPADHPALAEGWHTPERAGLALWRWTNGNARLPVTGAEGPVMVEIDVSDTTTYRLDSPAPEQRLAA